MARVADLVGSVTRPEVWWRAWYGGCVSLERGAGKDDASAPDRRDAMKANGARRADVHLVATSERAMHPAAARATGVAIARGDWLARPFLAYARLFARYHRHRVRHLDRLGALIRRGRRVVLVGNHVLDVLDPLLFSAAVLERYDCVPHFIGHENLIFGFPGLGALARRYGMIPSRHMEESASALERDGLLMLYPGSGSEAARRFYREEPYRLKWENRFGFLRLALRYDAEILFVAAIGIDEMYYQSAFEIPTWMLRLAGSERYAGSRFQFGLLGPHLLPGCVPFPVQITHAVSRPLVIPDRAGARRSKTALRRVHEDVWAQCQRLLDAEVARRERTAPPLDRAVRAAEHLLQAIGT
jgi:1-acyl-sn-glycerol-3-phosphate acyltransferase